MILRGVRIIRERNLGAAMRGLTLMGVLFIAACAPGQDPRLVNVRGQDVPTAAFVFFDEGSAVPQEESEITINEAAAFLTQYDNTVARVVGHVSPAEPVPSDPTQRLDRLRVAAVGARLARYGVSSDRIEAVTAGRQENMSQPGGDTSIDQRVDILFSTR